MAEQYADLHIHSCFSDGTMTPREILEEAKASGLALVAVADHNVLQGCRELLASCKKENIRCVSAVELDCLEHGANIHILAYGVNLEDEDFIRFVKKDRDLLDRRSSILIEKMGKDYPSLTAEDYNSYDYDSRLGGWKALHYFQHKGLTQSLKQGISFYGTYHCPYSVVDFPSVEETCHAVKKASGCAVLAHPGVVLDTSDTALFRKKLERLAACGLDGIECYYPTHSQEITQLCVEFCRAEGLLITAGSDCHGGFGRTSVGEMKIPMDLLNLGGLV